MGKSTTHRDRVYDIARSYVLQRGASGWSMDDLAAEAGITKRTLYKMIDSKERLVEEVVVGFIAGVQERIGAIIASERDYFTAVKSIMAEFPALAGGLGSQAISDILTQYPDVEKQVIARRNDLTAGIIAFFDRGIGSGLLKGDLTGGFVLQLFQAMVLYFIKASKGDEFQKNISAAFDTLMTGIRAGGSDGVKKGGEQ
ncbi:MAG: TetR/AcrR family transcriptional regulator [Spirochaetes bacterium]|nr:TetR/AcrR family transcriptional regulator [Spirochaetota bacterium]